MITIHKLLTELCTAAVAITVLSGIGIAQNMPKTTTEKLSGDSKVTTQQLSGTIVAVEGSNLVVRMSTGGLRTFNVPESRKFIVDGKELSVHELQPGTRLTATVTTTATSVTERTTTVGSGKVWYVSGNTVMLTLPNNENRMYKVKDSYRFNVNGQPATVHDLKKGMTVHAEKIVEEPKTEIASDTVVTGHAPPPPPEAKPTVAEAPAPAKEEAAPAPAPAPAQTQVAESKPPETLPKTASQVPLFGLLGLVLISAAFCLRKVRIS
jgi:hypothetical protein